jgi:acetoin:2,6-dichlorophenolindophenol oxidoreductase subunit alpha
MHLCNIEKGYVSSSAIVASNIPVAVGAAFVNKIKNNGKKVVVFFGDGAIEEGVFWESINMASLWSLPILFICEDNGLAVHTPSKERQGFRDIVKVVDNFNIFTQCELGVDAEKVFINTENILMNMKKYNKPGFIKLKYYRHLEHVGISSDLNEEYRKSNKWTEFDNNDPITLMQIKLKEYNIDILKLQEEITAKINVSLKNAKKAKFSSIEDLYKDIYYG